MRLQGVLRSKAQRTDATGNVLCMRTDVLVAIELSVKGRVANWAIEVATTWHGVCVARLNVLLLLHLVFNNFVYILISAILNAVLLHQLNSFFFKRRH